MQKCGMAKEEQFEDVAFYEDESHDLVSQTGVPLIIGTEKIHPEEMELLARVINIYRVRPKKLRKALEKIEG